MGEGSCGRVKVCDQFYQLSLALGSSCVQRPGRSSEGALIFIQLRHQEVVVTIASVNAVIFNTPVLPGCSLVPLLSGGFHAKNGGLNH